MKMLRPITLAAIILTASLVTADEPVDAAKLHIGSILNADFSKLEGSYASQVTLMPGHEFLKPKYKLTESEGRKEATKVDRKKLIDAMTKSIEGKPKRPADRITSLLESLKFEALKTTEGDFATESSDPVKTTDGKLHFKVEKSDVILKVAPPKGDFLLLQMRNIEGKWRIVAEYLD